MIQEVDYNSFLLAKQSLCANKSSGDKRGLTVLNNKCLRGNLCPSDRMSICEVRHAE